MDIVTGSRSPNTYKPIHGHEAGYRWEGGFIVLRRIILSIRLTMTLDEGNHVVERIAFHSSGS